MILPLGIWLLSVIFGTYLGHGLLQQLNQKRARKRWYVWLPDDKRSYTTLDENPSDYWLSILIQTLVLAVCIGVAMVSV